MFKTRPMRKGVFILLFCISQMTIFSQNTGSIIGIIRDKQTNVVLPGATVKLKSTSQAVTTDSNGYYRISNLEAGRFTLVVSHIGYETKELPLVLKNADIVSFDVSLDVVFRTGDEIVVSPSRRPEKITDAPASIQLIGRKELELYAGLNLFELFSKVLGVETIRIGVDGINLNARGMNTIQNLKVFQMIDGRASMYLASPGPMLGNNASVNKEDLEKIEVLTGPQTALYGPNVHNLLVNIITKDPRIYTGTSVAVSAGNQSQFSGRFRYAAKIDKKWAYKLTGEYAAGKDFPFYDSVKVGGGPMAAFGPRMAIPERIDDVFRHYRGETHVYYNITPQAYIIVTAGGSKNDFTAIQGNGHNQVRGMENVFLQGRYVSPHVFINVYNVWVNTGFSLGIAAYTRDLWNRLSSSITDPSNPNHRLTPDSAELNAKRITNRLAEKNQRFNAEVQYNNLFEKAGLLLVTGLSTQLDRPKAYGNTLVDSFERIRINQFGIVLQLEKILPWNLRFVSAARWDHHTNYGDFFSPKFGLVKKIAQGNLRMTWGQAYSMPSVSMQYASNVGVFFGNLKGITYIPNQTNVNDNIRKVTTPLKVEKVSTIEFGYRGTVTKKLYLDANLYDGISKNFFNPGIAVGGRALIVGDRRVTHNPAFAGDIGPDDTLRNASFSAVFNFGDVRIYGLDMGLTYTFNQHVNISIKYSWIGSDITKGNLTNDANKDSMILADEKNLNTPSNRVIASLDFQNLCKQKLFLNLSARYVSQFDFYGGAQISTKQGEGKWGMVGPYSKNFDWGPLGGFTSFDLGILYKFNSITSLGTNITNLFNTRQREAPGSPLIGRLIMFELRLNVPNNSDR